jgi:hypothetical protein
MSLLLLVSLHAIAHCAHVCHISKLLSSFLNCFYLQLDVKLEGGVPLPILEESLLRAKNGRGKILAVTVKSETVKFETANLQLFASTVRLLL